MSNNLWDLIFIKREFIAMTFDLHQGAPGTPDARVGHRWREA